jgi:MFS family permease
VRWPGALVDTRPLREHPAFRRLWLSTTASAFGGQVGAFAVVLYVWDSTRNPAMLGLIGLVTAAPLVAFALLGSAFADHVDRRRLALVTSCGQLATRLSMVVVAGSSGDRVWAMLALAGVSASIAAVGTPARRSLVPRLLPGDRLAAGLALNHLSFQLALLLGPALAGVLAARWGTTACFAVSAAMVVAGVLGIAGLPPMPATGDAGRPGVRAVWEGIRFATRTPAVRGAFLADLSATLLAMPIALFPVINQEKFGGSPEVLGLFGSALAVGGLLASGCSGLVTRGGRPGLVMLGCVVVWGVALAATGASGHLPATLALLAVAGAADTWAVVSRGSVVQASTPESHRGRVASLEHVVGVAGPELGGLRAGLVATATSGSAALVIGGITCVAGVGLVAALVPRLRRFTMAGYGPSR